MKCYSLVFLATVAVVLISMLLVEEASAGHHKDAGGTACIVKGSYCNCHYCKCEKGWVHCGYGKHGYGKKEKLFY